MARLEGGGPPSVGDPVSGALDWQRRHDLMRTHTALHVLCGVIWNEWGVPVTGGNMEPLSARMDFEFDPLPEGFKERVEELVKHRGGCRSAHRGVVPAAVGRIRITKTESKGKGNKRIRLEVVDAG